jgi:hypothetical protein
MAIVNSSKKRKCDSTTLPTLDEGFHWVGEPPIFKVLQNGEVKVTKVKVY